MNDPSSILRRNNGHRLSVAGATRSSFRSSQFETGSAKRKSLLSTPASTKRRQSSLPPGSTPSSSQQLHSSQQQQAPVTASPSVIDPRPLRDKNYISLLQQEVYDFLSANKFEIESGGHPLTQRTLRQPTQRDFVVVFQFLYHKIDPFHRFTKTIDNEVFILLRTLNYPYLETINRTQIASVNSSNWPAILGMLYWLVKLNLSLADLTIDGTDPILVDDQLDQIFIDYIRQSYRAFINNEDDYSPFLSNMKEKFDEMTKGIIEDIGNLEIENQQLQTQLDTLTKELSILEQSELKSKALESDLVKFKAYIETMESRKLKWSDVLDKIREEVTNCEKELIELESDKQRCQLELEVQGHTPKDIDGLYTERDKLTRLIDVTNSRIEELENQLRIKEIECQRGFESLDNFIKQYNAMVYRMGTASASSQVDKDGNNSNSNSYELTLLVNLPTSKPLLPADIINKTISSQKVQLLQYKSQINTTIHKHQDDSIKLQEQLDLMSEQITEKREEIETLEAKLSANKTTYDEIYETMTNDTTTYSMQIEKLERELRSIKINTNQGLIEVENRSQAIQIEYDELIHQIQAERSTLHDRVQRLIEFTIGFKINMQQNLEDLESLAIQESN
ncbi:kinetochore protein Ndc80p [[Candida] anglica]|uniref:Kinetochore protein NDC80 n=1 Tax=[Candida] anglica TaxID=148631 RepID=A0ABP0ECJ7_9ASCO